MHNECHFLVIITSAVLFLQLIITLPFFFSSKKRVDAQIDKNLADILYRLAKLEEQMAIERQRLKQMQHVSYMLTRTETGSKLFLCYNDVCEFKGTMSNFHFSSR